MYVLVTLVEELKRQNCFDDVLHVYAKSWQQKLLSAKPAVFSLRYSENFIGWGKIHKTALFQFAFMAGRESVSSEANTMT